MSSALVIGGKRGIGSVIVDHLRSINKNVFTVGRSKMNHKNHIACDILGDCSVISERVNLIDSVVFTHRYRGDDWDLEFETTIKSIRNVFDAVKTNLDEKSSVVILGSNAKDFVLDEQPLQYHASRAALEGLMRYYAVTYGKDGVRFNCILPATMIKPENQDFFDNEVKTKAMICDITPLGRMGVAHDIAFLVEFLCSDKASFITGNSIYLDGGLSLVGQESLARNLLNIKRERDTHCSLNKNSF